MTGISGPKIQRNHPALKKGDSRYLECPECLITYHSKHGMIYCSAVCWQRFYGRLARQVKRRIKETRGCIDCGYNEDPDVLDFDHVRGEKTRSISKISSLGILFKEIEKCEVRCANCHRKKTFKQIKLNRKPIPQEAIDMVISLGACGMITSARGSVGSVLSAIKDLNNG